VPKDKEMEAEVVVHAVEHEGAWSVRSGSDSRSSARRLPWRPRRRLCPRVRVQQRGRGRVSGEGEGEGMLVPLLIGNRAQGAWSKVGCASAVEAHGGHVHNTRRRSGISPSTWRASVRATWGANLGHFQAESVLGPKMKFVHRGLFYIFH
jgi:hypothetical protein